MSLVVKYTVRNEKSGRVTFRRVYPADVRSVTGWELKVPLGLEGSTGLLTRWEKAASDFEAAVDRARRQITKKYDILDTPTIAYLAEAFRVELLAEDEEARWSEEERTAYENISAQLRANDITSSAAWDGNEWMRWAGKARETINQTMPLFKELRAHGDLRGIVELWQSDAHELLEAKGFVVSPDADGLIATLCRAMNDAAIAAAELRLRRLDGEHVATPPEPEQPKAIGNSQEVAGRVPLLSTYDGYAKARDLTPGVRDEWRRYIEHLIKFLGHDDAARLTADKVREWRDHLLAAPTRLGRQRDPTTVRDKYLMALKTTLGWAVDEGRLKENVARQVILKKPKKVKLRDPSFTDEEALAILRATLRPVEGRLAPYYARARRWIPWLCAYSGARVNEFSQMRREDLVVVDGIWAVNITPEAGTVKTRVARLVPLHPHLIAQGFIEMVKAQASGPLFYDPSKTRVAGDSNRHFKKVGEKLAQWVRDDVGIRDAALQPNHAWRHRFKSLSYLHGIEERTADAIQGHAPTTTGRKYGAPPLASLAEAIAKLPRYEVEN